MRNPLVEEIFEKLSYMLEEFEVSGQYSSSRTYIQLLRVQLLMTLKRNLILSKDSISKIKEECSKIAVIERICVYKEELKIFE